MSIHFHKPNHTLELFSKLVKEVSHAHDWLAGPPMSEQDKMQRELFENQARWVSNIW